MKKYLLILLSVMLVISLCSCAAKTVEEETTEPETSMESTAPETTTLETVSGKLYAVTEAETMTNEFYCSGGTVTPERIAAGFTGWTGINFALTSEVDETAKTIKITWKTTSAMVTEDFSEANDGFEFDSLDELKTFMENSITESIRNNMGEYTVTFETAE